MSVRIATPRATDSAAAQGHDVIHDLPEPERHPLRRRSLRQAAQHARYGAPPDQRRSRCRPRLPVLRPGRGARSVAGREHALALFTMAASGWFSSWAKEASPPRAS